MKTLVTASLALAASAASYAATIDKVIVRQQWPWSTDVKVEYRITGVTAPVDVSVAAYDGETPLDSAKIAAATSGDVYGVSEDGDYSIMIDPVAAFGADHAAMANLNVELSLSDSAAKTSEVLYKIIDLDSFTVQDVTRADFMNRKMGAYETDFGAIGNNYRTALQDVLIWTGVTNVPAYKTSKIVMRKIPAKNVTFEMGNIPGTYKQRACNGYAKVTLTNDFYLSVFEVTEGQYKRMTAVNGTLGTCPSGAGDDMPAGKMQYNRLRGDAANWTGFPDNVYAVTSGSALQKLRNNMPGYLFDLPTEAQWEYACRAGTTNDLYIGIRYNSAKSYTNAMDKIAWYGANSGDSRHLGGGKRPNAFGLYDMLGNQKEECRDLVDGAEPTPLSGEITEPMGLTDTTVLYNIERGGTYGSNSAYCNAPMRGLNEKRGNETISRGLRLWLRAE